MSREVCHAHAARNCTECDPSTKQEETLREIADRQAKPEDVCPECGGCISEGTHILGCKWQEEQEHCKNCGCEITIPGEGEESQTGYCYSCYGQQEGQESKPEQKLKANTELGKKLLAVWIDHCSEDASSGDETLMSDLDDGGLLFEAVIALNQFPKGITISRECAELCHASLAAAIFQFPVGNKAHSQKCEAELRTALQRHHTGEG